MQALLGETVGLVRWVDPRALSELPEHSWASQIDDATVASLRESLRGGWDGPPIVTVGPRHQVVDGRHRALGALDVLDRVPVLNVSEEEFDAEVRRWPVRSLERIAQDLLNVKLPSA